GRRGGLEDATDHRTIGEHVEVVITPLAGGPGGGRAFEDQRRHSHAIVELYVSARRPTSVIFKRTTLSVRPPATTRSVVAPREAGIYQLDQQRDPQAVCEHEGFRAAICAAGEQFERAAAGPLRSSCHAMAFCTYR